MTYCFQTEFRKNTADFCDYLPSRECRSILKGRFHERGSKATAERRWNTFERDCSFRQHEWILWSDLCVILIPLSSKAALYFVVMALNISRWRVVFSRQYGRGLSVIRSGEKMNLLKHYVKWCQTTNQWIFARSMKLLHCGTSLYVRSPVQWLQYICKREHPVENSWSVWKPCAWSHAKKITDLHCL